MAKEYIEREAAKRAFFKGHEFVYYGTDVYERLDDIPAADVVPVRHGKWEKRMNIDIMIWCSECGWMKHQGDKRNYNYCSNCGARMDGDGEKT